MSLGLLFPGQGTQYPEMLPWLDDDAAGGSGALALLRAAVGADWRSRLHDPAWAMRNAVAQPLLTGACLAAWQRLAGLLPAPSAVAGYSVGELAAFGAAGVFGADAAMQLAQARARIMDECAAGHDGGLLSVGDAAPGLLERLCERHGLAVAIRIAPDRAILGGAAPALAAAAAEAARAGATVARLAISVASHTPWMAAAVAPWRAAIDQVAFAAPVTALVCNHGGVALRRPEALRAALAAQIASTVQWDRCVETMAERRVRCVLEIGPGATLSRLWNASRPGIPARSIDEFRSPEAAAAWARNTLA